MSLPFIGAFESTYLPAHDVDVAESSEHVLRWRADLELMRAGGVTRLRYPVRWHRVQPERSVYDWAETDRVLGSMRDNGMRPIVDLVHHTSYPRWLGGFGDPGFGPAYVAYCEAFARRYPWIEEYTLFNEPFATLFLCGHEAIWPPYGRGMGPLVELFRNVLPAIAQASRIVRELLPEARHVYVDTCEGHSALEPGGEGYAAMANDRRFFALDYMLGKLGDGSRPFVRDVVEAGGADLLDAEPGHVDVLGLDYYAHSEWAFRRQRRSEPAGRERHPEPSGIEGVTPSPQPVGPAALAIEYARRYDLPMIFSETNIRGAPADRATWLKYTLDECERAVAAGVPLEGYCWFPFIDSLDWNSLLARADRCIDPVGVYWLDEALERNASSMSRSYAMAAAGAASSELPAYRFTDDVAEWVAGLMPQMEHYDWIDAPDEESGFLDGGIVVARAREETAA
ncbi:MAG TPA: family 1 glycosylhydrolase [Thermoleophilaceae bacterium]|nr:family 1 glycosylhydrolase [Thermoleophilaceae bacterium]